MDNLAQLKIIFFQDSKFQAISFLGLENQVFVTSIFTVLEFTLIL